MRNSTILKKIFYALKIPSNISIFIVIHNDNTITIQYNTQEFSILKTENRS